MCRACAILILLTALVPWQPLSARREARGFNPRATMTADLGNTIDELAEMVKNLGKRLRSIRPRMQLSGFETS